MEDECEDRSKNFRPFLDFNNPGRVIEKDPYGNPGSYDIIGMRKIIEENERIFEQRLREGEYSWK